MTSEQNVKKFYLNAIVGEVIGTRTFFDRQITDAEAKALMESVR